MANPSAQQTLLLQSAVDVATISSVIKVAALAISLSEKRLAEEQVATSLVVMGSSRHCLGSYYLSLVSTPAIPCLFVSVGLTLFPASCIDRWLDGGGAITTLFKPVCKTLLIAFFLDR